VRTAAPQLFPVRLDDGIIDLHDARELDAEPVPNDRATNPLGYVPYGFVGGAKFAFELFG